MKQGYSRTISTKFNLGDVVFFLNADNVCIKDVITKIRYHVDEDGKIHIFYDGRENILTAEDELFESLEAVKKHVFQLMLEEAGHGE